MLNVSAPYVQGLKSQLWRSKRVVFTAHALEQSFGQQMLARMRRQNLDVTELSGKMHDLGESLEGEIGLSFPNAKLLYWT